MDPLEDLLEACNNYFEKKIKYNKAAENCEYDRDYFLHDETRAVERSKNEIKELLNTYIEIEVNSILKRYNLI
jgi:hypothetical protein